MTEADRMAKKMHCNFIGHLANEKDACVAVTGCPGDRMGFTVNSKHAGGSNRFTLHQNGTLEPIESAFNDMETFAESLNIPEEFVNGDEMANITQMQIGAKCAVGQCTALPETNLMRLKVTKN